MEILDRSTGSALLFGIEKQRFLIHHGIKGQKWGVRRGPPYPIKRDLTAVEAASEHHVISGHENSAKTGEPNSITDKVNSNGEVLIRTFYDSDGKKAKEIHTKPGNPKEHPYGEHGEHAHDYTWNENMAYSKKTIRELTEEERKENRDIL